MNLEDKLLNGPNVGYCSDSDGDSDAEPSGFRQVTNDEDLREQQVRNAIGPETGIKGVLNDYKIQTMLDRQRKLEDAAALMAIAKRGMLEGHSGQNDDQGDGDGEDELAEIRRRRLAELAESARGRLQEIKSKDEFLRVTDCSGLCVVLVLGSLSAADADSRALTQAFKALSSRFSKPTFAVVAATTLGMSNNFCSEGVPTLQVYFKGDLAISLVKCTDTLPTLSADAIESVFTSRDVRLASNAMYSTESDDDLD